MTSYIYNMVDTWASGGGPYTSIKMNATDNDVGSASLLMDLQVGGTSRFKVAKGGLATVGSLGFSANNLSLSAPDGDTIAYLTSGSNYLINGTTSSLSLASAISLAWSSSSQFGYASRDTFLTRRAAANLRLGAADAAAPVAQTLSVQSVVAGTSNTAGANLTITGSQGTGTGAGGSIIFQVAPAGSSGTAQNALQNALLIDGDGQATFTIKNTSGTPSLQIAKSGSSSIQITTSATFSVGSSASSLTLNANAGSSPIYAAGSYFNIGTAANNDVQLYRDAANTLALRNGANAQTFRVYNTYDGTNDERGFFRWASNVLQIGTDKIGTGTARTLEFQTDGVTALSIATNKNIAALGKLDVTQANTWLSAPILYVRRNTNDGSICAGWQANGFADGDMVLVPATSAGPRLLMGGTTSSFPALKRNSTALETKLADDSAYAPHAMQYLDVTDGVTAPASATGRARIYVDTADGDLKVIFADGTVKTIVTDT